MDNFRVTSNYGHIHIGPLYIGWNRNLKPVEDAPDCGDEIFGFCFLNYYIGYYTDGKWCRGFLNQYGYLD